MSRGERLEGLAAAVFECHVGRQQGVDYLPSPMNVNRPRVVGVVRPERSVEAWERDGYDPWSSGRNSTSTCFVPSLEATAQEGGRFDAEDAVESDDLERMHSLARHGKLKQLEDAYENARPFRHIDQYVDKHGCTLLHIASQNGHKRICKYCLRKGADINKASDSGNTALHFCFGSSFQLLGQYLIDKGADDSLLNADGHTCYEAHLLS
eukprot:g591.t1